jgi:hypothetical protein
MITLVILGAFSGKRLRFLETNALFDKVYDFSPVLRRYLRKADTYPVFAVFGLDNIADLPLNA